MYSVRQIETLWLAKRASCCRTSAVFYVKLRIFVLAVVMRSIILLAQDFVKRQWNRGRGRAAGGGCAPGARRVGEIIGWNRGGGGGRAPGAPPPGSATVVFVDILSFCSLSVLFCLFLHPPSFIFYVFLFLSFVLSLITCTIFIGDTITTLPCLFNYKCLMFKSTLIVVWQPSGYNGARLSLAVWRHFTCYIFFFVFTYYFVLSLKNKYTILNIL